MLINAAAPESKLKSAEGAALLDRISGYIQHFVSLSESQARIEALWVAHTHAVEAADSTPYLAITAQRKDPAVGSSQDDCCSPWMTGRVTVAALVRKVQAEQPTLLLDESDAAFKADKEYAEALRGCSIPGTSVAVQLLFA